MHDRQYFFLITNKYGKYIVVVLVIIDVKNTIVLLFAYSSTTTINLMFNICVFQNRGHDMDMNVQRAWKKGYTGQGVVVSILDDGIERDHPDLKNNYVSTHYTSIHGKKHREDFINKLHVQRLRIFLQNREIPRFSTHKYFSHYITSFLD